MILSAQIHFLMAHLQIEGRRIIEDIDQDQGSTYR